MTFFMKSTLHSVYFLPTKYYGEEININIDKMCSNMTTLRISYWPSLVCLDWVCQSLPFSAGASPLGGASPDLPFYFHFLPFLNYFDLWNINMTLFIYQINCPKNML